MEAAPTGSCVGGCGGCGGGGGPVVEPCDEIEEPCLCKIWGGCVGCCCCCCCCDGGGKIADLDLDLDLDLDYVLMLMKDPAV